MLGFVRADEGTRTPTVLLPLEPESSASANSATSAYLINDKSGKDRNFYQAL